MQFHENKRNIEFQVGLFTIIGIVILVAAYSWFTGWMEVKKYTRLQVFFSHVPMLEKGSPVTILGLLKGKIDSFEMKENGVVLHLLVELDFPLKEGTSFSVVESNIMGDVSVDIVPGEGDNLISINELQYGEENFTISNMIRQFSSISKKIDGMLSSFQSTEIWTEQITELIQSATSLIDDLHESLEKEKINSIVTDMQFVSSEMKKITTENKDKVHSTVDYTEKTVELMHTNMELLQASIHNLNKITEEMKTKDSDFRQLITQRNLYDQLMKTTSHLDSLLIDVKKNPKRYFQVKVF